MTKTRGVFTLDEKLSIVQEVERDGQTETCRKYNLTSSVLSYWKKNYLSKGKDGLKAAYMRLSRRCVRLKKRMNVSSASSSNKQSKSSSRPSSYKKARPTY